MQLNTALAQRQHYLAIKARLQAPAKPKRQPIGYDLIYWTPINMRVPRTGHIIYSHAIGPIRPLPHDVLQVASITNPFEMAERVKAAIADICRKHGISRDEIMANRRHKKITWARQEAMWWLRKNTPWSLPKIGQYFGGYDHTTVLHASRKHEARLAQGLAK